MKIIIRFLIILSSCSYLYSQPQFTISVQDFRWEYPGNSKVNLTIFLKIENTGDQKGWCEDLKGIYLDCSQNYYLYDIKLDNYSKNIVNEIKPGGYVDAFLSFKVPQDADGLSLTFDEFYGGASKFITNSYKSYLAEQKQTQYDYYIEEGDRQFNSGSYENAIINYKSALEKNSTKSLEVKNKIFKAYKARGDDYFTKNLTTLAIENYKKALENGISLEINQSLAKIYSDIGDKAIKNGDKKEAMQNYDLSLSYNENLDVRKKKIEIRSKYEKEQQKEEKLRQDKIAYNKLLTPKTGWSIGGGLAIMNKETAKSTGTLWNITVGITPKLYVSKSSFTVFTNIDLGFSGLITSSSNNTKYKEFYNLDTSVYQITSGTSASFIDYFMDAGLGIALINESITPMLTINYGLYLNIQNVSMEKWAYINGNYELTNVDIKQAFWGNGYSAGFNILFGRKFYIGYTYKSFSISDTDFRIFNGNYIEHKFKLGLMFF